MDSGGAAAEGHAPPRDRHVHAGRRRCLLQRQDEPAAVNVGVGYHHDVVGLAGRARAAPPHRARTLRESRRSGLPLKTSMPPL